jgi:hypothetical protein
VKRLSSFEAGTRNAGVWNLLLSAIFTENAGNREHTLGFYDTNSEATLSVA